jgi:hypothetical protein
MISLPGALTWDEAFSNAVIVDDDTRVYKNTLGPRFIFAGGKHIDDPGPPPRRKAKVVWVCVYVEMRPAVMRATEKWICEGRTGSVRIIEWADGWKLIFQAANGIGAGVKVDLIGEPPQKLQRFFKRAAS